jgi:hypothetical protein
LSGPEKALDGKTPKRIFFMDKTQLHNRLEQLHAELQQIQCHDATSLPLVALRVVRYSGR